jgi:tetratricopeptide (TPR) repeat protein
MPTALPKKLEAMIADARCAVERWDDEGDEDQDAGVKEWFVRLSRGEYDQDLYWKCVAEDCEAEGDWEGAKNAYRRQIDFEANGRHGFLSAHSDLAGLHALLGEQGPALEHARRATTKEHCDRLTGIAFRCAIVYETWLLLNAGRTRAARRLIKRGLNSFEEDSPDALGYAKLQTAWAACELAARRAGAAEESLQDAWTYLEAVREWIDVDGGADAASGLQGAYATWWRVEAKRRRLVGDGAGEIEALEQAVASARRAATGWSRVGRDASVMRALSLLSEAQHQQGQFDEAAKTQSEAQLIRSRWRLPEVDATESGDGQSLSAAAARGWRWLRSLFRKFD